MLYEEIDDADNDHVTSFSIYKEAAELGVADAQCRLEQCYEDSKGIEKNTLRAISWYDEAAAQGHAHAQFRLGYYVYL